MSDKTLPAGVTAHACVTVACCRCRRDYQSDDAVWHFTSLEEAAAHLADEDWRVDGGGAVCVECVCAETGHEWGPWRGEAARRYRQCAHCGMYDLRRVGGAA